MPIYNYGVLAAYPIHYELKARGNPHVELFVDENQAASRGKYRAAINVRSSSAESRLVYWFDRDFSNPVTQNIVDLPLGFTSLDEKNGLDYIRGNLMNFKDGKLLEYTSNRDDVDLVDYMRKVLDNAIAKRAKVFLLGEPFPKRNQNQGPDYQGIHDIHMNQGNAGQWMSDNGTYQDGGILFSFPDGHWEAIFLAFAVQSIHTDDESGNPIGDVDFASLLKVGGTVVNDGKVYIEAALVNPTGPDGVSGEKEAVYIQNLTTAPIVLDDWKISNKAGNIQRLRGTLQGNSKGRFEVPNCPLSNRGGTITLMDGQGLKVDGVSYTADQAAREGVLLYFH